MNQRVYRFTVPIDPSWDVPYGVTLPVYDHETSKEIGAFLMREDSMISAFLAGTDYPLSLEVSTGGAFYFTPQFDHRGQALLASVSLNPLNTNSKLISEAAE